MNSLTLLCLITVCYAAYNLLVKVSGNAAGQAASPILATLSLQLAALSVSLVYLLYLSKTSTNFALPGKAYGWAILAGVCIGLAEVMYFYLFRGVGGEKPAEASVAVPVIVGGTILLAVVVSHFLFRESLNTGQWAGIGLAVTGLIVLAINSRVT